MVAKVHLYFYIHKKEGSFIALRFGICNNDKRDKSQNVLIEKT